MIDNWCEEGVFSKTVLCWVSMYSFRGSSIVDTSSLRVSLRLIDRYTVGNGYSFKDRSLWAYAKPVSFDEIKDLIHVKREYKFINVTGEGYRCCGKFESKQSAINDACGKLDCYTVELRS